MSRDIRSYFSPRKPANPSAVVEDDDALIPESPDVQIIKNKKKKRVLERRDKSEKTTTSTASRNKTEDSKKSTEKSDDKKQKSTLNTESNKDLKKTDESKLSLKKSKSTESKKNNDKDHTKVEKADKDQKLPKRFVDKFIQCNLNQSSIDSNEIKKSKIDLKSKRKAKFLETDSSQDQSSKKKKLNKSMEAKSGQETKEYDCDSSVLNDDEKESHKRKKMNKSVLTDEHRLRRRMMYKNYRNRPEPKHLGAKEIPEGKPDCLKDCSFLMTGVLDSFLRDEIAAAITKYGGCVKSGVSKKVTHVLAGNAAGPAKMAKAQELIFNLNVVRTCN
ncbi:replication factor C subunit 1-like [Helicoverpa zea]|uniref:replication factor C subunit 1-like n=1 Tax=Helicoverpa zea TaxID=7113 RepID=UPI001F5848CD|nr:replication factor C subunit 1-like [Helicoverpa zea]